MKKFLLVFLISIPIFCFCQDNIILKNGDEVYCKVFKVDSESITYKKYSNLIGPDYIISIDKVFMIKYENGEKDIFNNLSTKNDKIKKDVDWSKFTHIVLNQGIVGEGQAVTGGMVLISPLATAISNHNANRLELSKNVRSRAERGFLEKLPFVLIPNKSILNKNEYEFDFIDNQFKEVVDENIIRVNYTEGFTKEKCMGYYFLYYEFEFRNSSNDILHKYRFEQSKCMQSQIAKSIQEALLSFFSEKDVNTENLILKKSKVKKPSRFDFNSQLEYNKALKEYNRSLIK